MIECLTQPTEWRARISLSDEVKLRRLILSKLFHGWRSEVHQQRVNSHNAMQILTRMMRRSRGPMWLKEAVLVCFHMWRRYSAVRVSYI